MSASDRAPRKSLKQRLRDHRAAARKRKATSGAKFVIADSIRFLPPEDWDQLTQNASVFLSRSYLKALEANGPDNVAMRYVIAWVDEKPVAAMACQLIEINGQRLISEMEQPEPETTSFRQKVRLSVSAVLSSARRRAIAKIRGRILMCGNALSWGFHGNAFAPDLSQEDAWTIVAEALYRIRRAEKLSGQTDIVLIKDFEITAERGPEQLAPFRYRRLETDPNMVLSIPASWKSFEDYLNSLASKYRSATRRILRDFDSAGLKLEQITDLEPIAPDLLSLYKNVQQRASVRPVSIPESYLPALAKTLGDGFRCTVARKDGRVVGFITSLRDRETSVGYYVGFDYEINESAPLYFRLLLVCIQDAIQFGCREVSFGRTALEPKARMGAKPQPMEVWLRHRQPILNWMIRGLLTTIPHDEAPDRNPFKTSTDS